MGADTVSGMAAEVVRVALQRTVDGARVLNELARRGVAEGGLESLSREQLLDMQAAAVDAAGMMLEIRDNLAELAPVRRHALSLVADDDQRHHRSAQ